MLPKFIEAAADDRLETLDPMLCLFDFLQIDGPSVTNGANGLLIGTAHQALHRIEEGDEAPRQPLGQRHRQEHVAIAGRSHLDIKEGVTVHRIEARNLAVEGLEAIRQGVSLHRSSRQGFVTHTG